MARMLSHQCALNDHAECAGCDCTCHDDFLLNGIERVHNDAMMDKSFDQYPNDSDDLLSDEIEHAYGQFLMDEADREDTYFAIDSATDEELGFEPEVDYDAESCIPIPVNNETYKRWSESYIDRPLGSEEFQTYPTTVQYDTVLWFDEDRSDGRNGPTYSYSMSGRYHYRFQAAEQGEKIVGPSKCWRQARITTWRRA